MSLTNLHTSANYQDELHIFLKQVENKRIKGDGSILLTIG